MLPQTRCILRSNIRSYGIARQCAQYRGLLTLAVESSADDTAVAVVETQYESKNDPIAKIHYHEKITANNAEYKGIHPRNSAISHQKELPGLISRALRNLPRAEEDEPNSIRLSGVDHTLRKPTFVAATRGPGMRGGLSTGLDMVKGVSIAYDIPFMGIHHMQAHALTPRLVSALSSKPGESLQPAFPFRTLLVSGGHTMLLNSRSLVDFEYEASTSDIAAGDCIDKMAKFTLPASFIEQHTGDTNYGSALEKFAFPNGAADYQYTSPSTREQLLTPQQTRYGWAVPPPLQMSRQPEFSFTGLDSAVRKIALNGSARLSETKDQPRQHPMELEERRLLARHSQRVLFEHIADRINLVLQPDSPNVKQSSSANDKKQSLGKMKLAEHRIEYTLVVSGGVASNKYFRHVLQSYLEDRGLSINLVCPPVSLCTDNALMIAWAAIEMWNAGNRTALDCTAENRWPLSGSWQDI